jgi:hypothetical protein
VPEPKTPAITRRQFATTAVLVTAAATLGPVSPARAADDPQTPQPAVSPTSQTEADLRLQTILALYGSALSDDQKADLKKICNNTQSSLDRLRAYPTENSDDPALCLKPLWEHEKNPLEPSNARQTSAAPKS